MGNIVAISLRYRIDIQLISLTKITNVQVWQGWGRGYLLQQVEEGVVRVGVGVVLLLLAVGVVLEQLAALFGHLLREFLLFADLQRLWKNMIDIRYPIDIKTIS